MTTPHQAAWVQRQQACKHQRGQVGWLRMQPSMAVQSCGKAWQHQPSMAVQACGKAWQHQPSMAVQSCGKAVQHHVLPCLAT